MSFRLKFNDSCWSMRTSDTSASTLDRITESCHTRVHKVLTERALTQSLSVPSAISPPTHTHKSHSQILFIHTPNPHTSLVMRASLFLSLLFASCLLLSHAEAGVGLKCFWQNSEQACEAFEGASCTWCSKLVLSSWSGCGPSWAVAKLPSGMRSKGR